MAVAALAPGATRLRTSLIGRTGRAGPIVAALIDGVAAGAGASIATPVVCAALAACEAAEVPGAMLLDAVVAGVEVALRVERALRGHVERGWDVRGTCGRLGAAIAAARAFGLTRAAAQNAFGLAATAAGGLTAARGTMTETYIIGSAAADGVEAALLARAEFTAAPAALDGRRGLAALTAAGFDAHALIVGLGERFAISDFAVDTLPDVPARLRDAVAGLERAPSLAELIAATQA
jgi:2-methylcitrate dehydratase PrpD